MNLLLTGAYQYTYSQIKQLETLGYKIRFVQDERVPLDRQLTSTNISGIDAVVCNGLFLCNDITKFKNLKLIQLTSAGLDKVPLNYIKKHGIKIFNAKAVYSIPMAEWVILKILEIYKKSRLFYVAQYEHKWEKQRNLLELTDKTATIIGFGNIGAEIAKRLKTFGINVIGVGRRKIESDLIDEYYLIDNIDEVLRKSDILIVTLPHTAENLHLINADKIANMKDNSVLINVSRGGVINESALIKALQEKKFLGVALDVFAEEPLPENSPLWDLENLIITPHNSFVSEKIDERLFELIVKNLHDYKVSSA